MERNEARRYIRRGPRDVERVGVLDRREPSSQSSCSSSALSTIDFLAQRKVYLSRPEQLPIRPPAMLHLSVVSPSSPARAPPTTRSHQYKYTISHPRTRARRGCGLPIIRTLLPIRRRVQRRGRRQTTPAVSNAHRLNQCALSPDRRCARDSRSFCLRSAASSRSVIARSSSFSFSFCSASFITLLCLFWTRSILSGVDRVRQHAALVQPEVNKRPYTLRAVIMRPGST